MLLFISGISFPGPLRHSGLQSRCALSSTRIQHVRARSAFRALCGDSRNSEFDTPDFATMALRHPSANSTAAMGPDPEYPEPALPELELEGDGGIADGGSGDAGDSRSWGGSSRGDGEGSGESLPDDLSRALAAGALSSEALARYRAYASHANPFARLAMAIPAFRSRILADSEFIFKLLVQELIGNGTALASEFAVRGKEIVNELEYVASDLIVGTVVEAAFVWLLAPRLAGTSSVINPGRLAKWFESLPANAFEASTPLRRYTFPLRFASFINAGLQYAAIGLVAGVVGTAITYGLVEARKKFDKNYIPERPLPAIWANSSGWAAFMALSSNTRFQAVEGIERALHIVLKGDKVRDALLKASIVGIRFGNNYWGGVQFIQFFRFLGLHAVAD